MKLLAYPVHLIVKHRRKRDHNKGPVVGWTQDVPRVKDKPIHTLVYRPAGTQAGTLPVLFNVHGGAWLYGDAEGLDRQSQYLADSFGCMVVNIDYLRVDEKPFPYQQQQVSDVVEYFLARPERFHLDPDRAVLMGYSAGGHISAGAAFLLRDRGIRLKKQVLCYPFLNFIGFDFANYVGMTGLAGKGVNAYGGSIPFTKLAKDTPMLSPANAAPEALKGLAPAVIITCGTGDGLLPQGEDYAEKLRQAGVDMEYREFGPATHGFLEGAIPRGDGVQEDVQCECTRQAVAWLRQLNIFE